MPENPIIYHVRAKDTAGAIAAAAEQAKEHVEKCMGGKPMDPGVTFVNTFVLAGNCRVLKTWADKN